MRAWINPLYRCAAAILIMSTINAAPAQSPAPADFSVLDDMITSSIASRKFPGAVLLIGRGPQVQYEKAYGKYTYAPEAKPMTLDTLFDMASVSKVVGTASTAMALMEDGKLDINAPVADYVNGFGANGKAGITIKDLMTHVSGLPAYDSPENAKKLQSPGISSADALIMRIAQLKPRTEPRTTVTYSCLNMLTQARVNENILAGRQDDFITSRMYAPLGMKDTTYRPTAEQLQRTAPTVNSSGKDLVGRVHDPLASFHSPELHCPGNAGVFSTGHDMARFCEMIAGLGTLDGKQVFKPETIKLMTSVQTPKGIENLRGLGWDIFPKEPYATPANLVDGKRSIGHTGYTGTMIWIDMNTGAWMVFLTNRTYPDDNKASGEGTTAARKQIISTVLRHQPEYKDYFASLPPAKPTP